MITITISLDSAKYTAREYELFSVRGHGLAARNLNKWLDAEIAKRAGSLGSDPRANIVVGSEVFKAVRERIYAANYHNTFGALDSEPRWLICHHIAKTIRRITGMHDGQINSRDLY